MRTLRRLRALFGRQRFEAELDEELRFHLEHAAEEYRREGIDPAAARARARRQFGSSTAIHETTRDLFAFAGLEAVWRDVFYGARSLGRNPVMVLVAVLSLSLGIGATATLYSLIDSLVIHDVTAREADRLVRFNSISYPNYQEIRASGVFQDVAGYQIGGLLWRDGDRVREAIAHYVSANFFECIGVQAALGRTFTAREAAPETNPRVIVISNRFWRQGLGADPHVLGRVLSLGNTAYTIVGVLPAGYRSIQGVGVRPDVFMPFNADRQPGLFQRRAKVMIPVARLQPGRAIPQTQAALMAVLHALEQRFPDHLDDPQSLYPVQGFSWHVEIFRPIAVFSFVLAGAVGLILLIACANVAGLLLARAAARRREIAIRTAIGAARPQLVRQFLIESAMLAAAGTLGGLGFTFVAATLLSRVTLPGMPVAFIFVPDWRLAASAAVLGAVATILGGLAPALAGSHADLTDSLRANRAAAAPRLRLRTALVGAQIAISVALLGGAFVFLRNLEHVFHLDPGFDVAHTLSLDIANDRDVPFRELLARRERITRDLESAPGVEAVSWAWYLPFNIEFPDTVLRRDDRANATEFHVVEQGIGPQYLNTMRIPLLAGREFAWQDLNTGDADAPEPVVINRAFARAYFPDGNPVGRRLLRVGRGGAGRPLMVIGLAADADFLNPGEAPVPLLQSLARMPQGFLVRVAGPADAAAPALRQIVARDIPGAGTAYTTVRERFYRGTWPARAATVLLGVFAALGLILTVIGLSGVSVYNVTRRTSEIGIRMALGASPASVVHLMLREGLLLVAPGALAGLLLALALTRPLARFLAAGISPADPLAYGAMLSTLLLAAGISVWLPARRAARVDPSESLRAD